MPVFPRRPPDVWYLTLPANFGNAFSNATQLAFVSTLLPVTVPPVIFAAAELPVHEPRVALSVRTVALPLPRSTPGAAVMVPVMVQVIGPFVPPDERLAPATPGTSAITSEAPNSATPANRDTCDVRLMPDTSAAGDDGKIL